MTSATSSFESQQGNGRLKLKIKFSKSKGFVSDFVKETVPAASLHVQDTAVSEPISRSELWSSSQPTDIFSPAAGSELSSIQHTHVSSSTVGNLDLSSKPTVVRLLSSNDNTGYCQELCVSPDFVHRTTTKEPVCDHKEGTPVPHNSNDQPQIVSDEGSDKYWCTQCKPGHTDLPGVHYGEMLQDLEFLSAQQDEPDGRGFAHMYRQRERHLSAVKTAADVKVQTPEEQEPGGAVESKAGVAGEQEESMDGEPLSPLDINCSLGLADEEFTFSASTQNASQKQNGEGVVRENPLCPWSVDGTSSYAHCAGLVSSSDVQKQPDSGEAGAGGVSIAQWSSGDQCVKISLEQSLVRGSPKGSREDGAGECTVKSSTVLGCPGHGGSRLGSEINNNGHIPQFRDSDLVSRSRPDNKTRTILQPAALVASDSIQDGSVTPVFLSVGDSMPRSSIGSESESRHPCLSRILSLGPGLPVQEMQYSAENRHSSSFPSDEQHPSASMLCTRTCADTSGDMKESDQPSDSTASHHPSVPQPQLEAGKECSGAKPKHDLLVNLLKCKGKPSNTIRSDWLLGEQTSQLTASDESMKQLAENPPSIELLPRYETSETAPVPAAGAVLVSSAASAASVQLTHTINELRKRVQREDHSDASPEIGPPSEACRSASCSSSSSDAKRKQSPMAQWCRCDKPELFVLSTDHENVTDSKASKDKICRKCGKKAKSKCKRKVSLVWCHCDAPSPYVPNSTVSEMCSKCLKRVSKKWRKRTAAKWCKCHTPVLCTYRPANNPDENMSDRFYTCRRCQKWIGKEREDVCMRGDSFGQFSGENIFPPMGPQHSLTDHNYSQSPFSPNALAKRSVPASVSATHQTAEREETGELAGNSDLNSLSQTGPQGTGSSEQLFYIFPISFSAEASESSFQFCSSQVGHCATTGGSGVSQPDLLKVQTESSEPVTLSSAAAASLSSGGVSSGSVLCSSASSAFTVSSEACPGQNAAPVSHTRVIDIAGGDVTSASRGTKRTLCKITCPPWLQGICHDALQPCYVVMEKLSSELLPEQSSVSPVDPCSVACRQNSLNVLCRHGDLQQCGHSLEYTRSLDKCTEDGKNTADQDKKRDYFRQNKTMVGYEEFRLKETERLKHQRAKRQKADDLKRKKAAAPVGGTTVINSAPPGGSFPPSSQCPQGFINIRITPRDGGVTFQQMSENVASSVSPVYHRSDQLQLFSGYESVQDISQALSAPLVETAQDAKQRVNGMNRNLPEFLESSHLQAQKSKPADVNREGRNSWLKTSQFHVKYYMFSAQNRAFIVPLIQNRRQVKTVPQLDQEDLGYVRKVINQLLLEKDSCARHMKYPDSLRHKEVSRTVGQCANKRSFVAPTLGGEDLDIEGLKSLISDRDFSRLVPRNTRISKSKYLQEIGEKVHMYLTGGCEETPEWIKDVAKSIVLKHRKRVKSKPRLKPSKDVSIEIDYAEEEELLEVGEEGIMSPSHASVTDSHLSATGSGVTTFDTDTADQTTNPDQGQLSDADHTTDPIGSYVVAEAFAQEEKKPLIQNMVETAQESSGAGPEANIPPPGQQIFVPLPDTCSYSQGVGGDLTTPPLPSSCDAQQQNICERSVSEENQDTKPLLGELLAANILPSPTSVERASGTSDHSRASQVHEQYSVTTAQTSQPSEQQLSPWPLAAVKEEPPDDDYSHAWPDQGQADGMTEPCFAQRSREGLDSIPFISNSTFGKDAVQIEDEEGSAVASVEQLSCTDSGTEVHSCIKMEPRDAESGPLITCVASGEFSTMLAFADHGDASSMEVNAPGSFSAHLGEAVTYSIDANPSGVISSVVEVAACSDQSASGYMPSCASYPDEKATEGLQPPKDTLTFGELISRSVENNACELLEEKDSGMVSICEQTQVIILPESVDLPQISALSFEEAAKIWGTEDGGHVADLTKPNESSAFGCTETLTQSEVVPVITSVLCGEAAEEEDEARIFQQEPESACGQQTASHDDGDEDCSDDLLDGGEHFDEESSESDLKPMLTVEGQVLAVPIVFPSESNLPDTREEAREEHALNTPQDGVDLSVVKLEPQEPRVSSETLVNDSHCIKNCDTLSESSVLSSHQHTDFCFVVDEPSPVPSILEVRSLALELPSDRAGDTVLSEVSHRSQNCSPARTSSLQEELHEGLNPDPYSSDLASDVNGDVSEMTETETNESIHHQASEKVVRQQKRNRPCSKSASSRANSKRGCKKSAGKGKYKKVSVAPAVTAQDSTHHLNGAGKASPGENTVSSAEDVDLFVPPKSPLSCISASASHASSPSNETGNIEHERNDSSIVAKLPSTISVTDSSFSSIPVMTFSSEVMSDGNSVSLSSPDTKITPWTEVPSTRGVIPEEKCSSVSTDTTPAEDSTESGKSETPVSCSIMVQPSSGISFGVQEKDNCSNHDVAPARGEVTPPKTDSPVYVKDSDKNAMRTSEVTQVFCDNTPKETNISVSHESTPNFDTVLASKGAVMNPDGVGEVTANGQKNNTVVADVSQDCARLCLRRDKEGLKMNFPRNLPQQDTVDKAAVHLTAEPPKKDSLTEKSTDDVISDQDKKTPAEAFVTVVSDSHTSTARSDCTKANGDVKKTEDSVNIHSAKTCKSGNAVLRSKRKNRKRSNPGKTNVNSSTSLPTGSDLSLDTTDNESQDTQATSYRAALSSFSSPPADSDQRDNSVLRLRITRSSKSFTKCLSENQVSSSCDISVTSHKSDCFSAAAGVVNKSSTVSLDLLRSGSEKKSVERDGKEHSKLDREPSHHVVQPLPDGQSRRPDGGRTSRSERNILDENARYVSQISEGKGKQGRPCLVIRKQRPAQSPSLPPSSSTDSSRCHVFGDEQLDEKDPPVPLKKLKEDITCKPLLSKMEIQSHATPRGQKRKSDDTENQSNKGDKAFKSERSIFSDLSAVLSSMSGSSSGSASASSPEACPRRAGSALTNAVPSATVKVAEKGFSPNLFSRLRASLGSVKDSAGTVKDDGAGIQVPGSGASSASSHSARERSFFDCLPQGYVDAWKNK